VQDARTGQNTGQWTADSGHRMDRTGGIIIHRSWLIWIVSRLFAPYEV
jgi:hypothetical protein